MTEKTSDARTVLVVDDRATTRQILTYTLETAGYRTIEAADGFKAVELAMDRRVDLIVLDIMLPGMDGLKVLERLRGEKKTKEIPVIAVSARSQKEDILKTMEAGADAYIVKPFDKDTVLEKVGQLLKS